MSLLGRFWPAQRRTTSATSTPDPASEQVERPSDPEPDVGRPRALTADEAPPTGPLAQAGPATGWFLRRRRRGADWGPAHDVELGPAPPPDARPSTRDDAVPAPPRSFGGDLDGVAFGQGPFAAGAPAGGDGPVVVPPPPAPDDPAAPGSSPLAPPWRRPATPPWGFTAPTGSDGATSSERPDDLARSASSSPVGALAGAGVASSALVAGSAHPMSSSPDDRVAGPGLTHQDIPTTTEDSMTAPSTSLPTTDPDEPDAPGTPPSAEPATVATTAPRHAVTTTGTPGPVDRHHVAQGRLGIDEVTPEVEGGRFPSKAVVGEVVPIGATVWREGHDAVAATVVWERDEDSSPRSTRMVPSGVGTDRFAGHIVPDAEGPWSFRVDAWSDPWATWRHAVEVKVGAGQGAAELANDLETGARLLDRAAAQLEDTEPASPAHVANPLALAQTLTTASSTLRDADLPLAERLARAMSEPVDRTMSEHPVRDLVTEGETHHVVVERPIALAGSWYEFFPRSTGGRDADGTPVHGTFATAARELDRVAAMGFDVAYLPPIHPIGAVNRKGPNNTLTPGPDDVGSPWAIGSVDGGHDAVHPDLGTIDDFDAFVARAHELGLEVALDLALQCAPDHPWAGTHPEWFVVRPDGTIAYAENPPKRYQDIYPVNFDTDPDGIYAEVLRVVEYWMEHGVRIFRVDNPHTKPPDFWCWLIAEVHRRDPGVVFLAEAFTRPARLFGLAKAGFSQSYTYFTWRTGKDELAEFFSMHRDRIDECRPNCFVNTPDILHESLQLGGPGMFAIRAALAATLSPTWGVYSGFELFEHVPVRPGTEEYLNSEKYQLRPRDFAGEMAAGRSLQPWLTRLNQLRRTHPALTQIRSLEFHDVDNDGLLAYSKVDPITGDTVLCVVTLDPFAAQDGTVRLDMPALGLDWDDRFAAHDEVSGQTFDWGQANYVRLEPWRDVAHVVSVGRR